MCFVFALVIVCHVWREVNVAVLAVFLDRTGPLPRFAAVFVFARSSPLALPGAFPI